MTQVASGFERRPMDIYETPPWPVDALAEVIPLRGRIIWEPACGPGKMVRALQAKGAHVIGTDIVDYGSTDQAGLFDFTSDAPVPDQCRRIHAIVTNPPYGARNKTAEVFIERGLGRLPNGGFMALLLPADFDHAKTRAHLFGDCPHFAGKITLRKRIQWFDPPPGEKGVGGTQWHAFFVWRRDALGQAMPPRIWYAPRAA